MGKIHVICKTAIFPYLQHPYNMYGITCSITIRIHCFQSNSSHAFHVGIVRHCFPQSAWPHGWFNNSL